MQRIAIGIVISATLFSNSASAQYLEEETLRLSESVLHETMTTSMNAIPKSMLADSHGVAIIPNVIKGSFVIGARHGRGILFVRGANGAWHAPVFISLTGGNVGWQIGVQSSDIVLVFKTAKSVNGLLNGKLTLGADAAVAAGPLGRQGSVGTDGRLSAEVYSYSRSRGLFAGVAIDGSVVSVDQLATGAYYRSPAPGQPVVVPASAQALTHQIALLSGTSVTPQQPAQAGQPLPNSNPTLGNQQPPLVQQHAASEADVLRKQLAQLAPEMFEMLDPSWRAYLALPASLFVDGPHPNVAQLRSVLGNYQVIATDARYRELAARPEFHSVYGLLRHYVEALSPSQPSLNLPPPPGSRTAVLPQ